MTYERGHLSIYFKEEEVLDDLQGLVEKDLDNKVSVSSVVCEILKGALPQLRESIKKGKRVKVKLNFEVSV